MARIHLRVATHHHRASNRGIDSDRFMFRVQNGYVGSAPMGVASKSPPRVRPPGIMVPTGNPTWHFHKKEIVLNMFKIRISMAFALMLVPFAGAADAGQMTNMQLLDGTSGSPVVTVHYSNPDGSGNNQAATYADPMVSGGTKSPFYYCVDLWHENNLGSSYTFTTASSLPYATSTFTDVDNRLAWLVDQPQATVDERAAVQLALWYTIDNIRTTSFSGFSYSGGDSTLRSEYDQLITFAGYNPLVHYDAGFWAANHDTRNVLYQDLISSVPEPSALLLATIGLAAGVGIYARRVRRSSPAA